MHGRPKVADGGLPEQLSAVRGIRPEAIAFTAIASGAASMGLEIVASRLLAPFYGTSVYVWGALITVTMVALSLGYYCGGIIADRKCPRHILSSLCFAVAIWLFGIAGFSDFVLSSIAQLDLGEQVGAMFASSVIFLPPEFGIGLLSPLAVRAATMAIEKVGRSSGTLSACSAVGGIVGTIVVTFGLIPYCGVRMIVVILAVTMLFAGFFAMTSRPTIANCVIWLSVATIGTLGAFSSTVQATSNGLERFRIDTPYNSISVVDHDSIREMRFGRFVETAIVNSPPYQSVAGYTNYFNLAWTFRRNASPALFIGAGGGVGPRCFFAIDAEAEMDVVDIDPAVIEVAKSLFHMPDDPRIRCYHEDGRIFLSRRSRSTYNCIVLDAFGTGGRIPSHLATREFFELCRSKLTDDGLLIMNINSARNGSRSGIFSAVHSTLLSTFPNVIAFAVNKEIPAGVSANIVLFASSQPIVAKQFGLVSNWTDVLGLPKFVLDRMLSSAIDPAEIARGPILSDDWSPIDLMSF